MCLQVDVLRCDEALLATYGALAMLKGCVLLVVFLLSGCALGQSSSDLEFPSASWLDSQAEEAFEQANSHYNDKAFAEAIRLYEELVASFPGHAGLRYNLANAYLRLYQSGSESGSTSPSIQSPLARSIYHYQKSLLKAPMERHTRENLHIALSYVSSAYNVSADFFGLSRYLLRALRAKVLVLNLLVVLLGVTIASFFLGRSGESATKTSRVFPAKRVVFLGLLGFLYATVVFGEGVVGMAAAERSRAKAVVLPQHIELRDQPNAERSEVVFDLYEGNIIEVSRTNEDRWALISLPNGRSGWLEARHLLQFD